MSNNRIRNGNRKKEGATMREHGSPERSVAESVTPQLHTYCRRQRGQRQTVYNARGRAVGALIDSVFYVRMEDSSGMLDDPPALILDSFGLRTADQLGAKTVVVYHVERHLIYSADIDFVLGHSIKLSGGLCALPLDRWHVLPGADPYYEG